MSYNVGAFCLIKLNCLHYISEDFYIFFLYNNIVSYHNLIIDKNISRLLSKIYSKDTFKLIIVITSYSIHYTKLYENAEINLYKTFINFRIYKHYI